MKKIDLAIIGAQKAGTTSFANYVAQHPSVCTHKRREFTYFILEEEYNMGFEVIAPQYLNVDEITNDKIVCVKNVSILYSEEAQHRLMRHNSDVAVVVLLREPVSRAYSAYWYARQLGWETLSTFEDAIRAPRERFASNSIQARSCDYLGRSHYSKHIQKLHEVFPNENTYIWLLDDFKKEPKRVFQELFEHLHIDASFTPSIEKRQNRSGLPRSQWLAQQILQNARLKKSFRDVIPSKVRSQLRERAREFNYKSFDPPPMKAETRAYLKEYFRPLNDELATILNRDLSHWNE